MAEVVFKNKKFIAEKLLQFGFKKENGRYFYSEDIMNGQMSLEVSVYGDGKICTKTVDRGSNDEYVLHLVDTAEGAFVGQVKAEYEAVLSKISESCFEADIYKSEQTKAIIEHVRKTYSDELEYLWKKSDNAIWRRKDTQKWYGALLFVPKNRLGIDSDERVEILDLRIKPEEMESLIDNRRYFSGYHMNKKHWFTVCLDGSVSFDELCQRIDESYRLAK